MTVVDDTAAHADSSIDALIDAVREAAASKTALAIRGNGTKTWYGHRVVGTSLDVRDNTGIVDYEPSELVLVARAGTTLQEIEQLLAKHRQMLPFEPPRFMSSAASAVPASTASPAGDAPASGAGDAPSRARTSARRGATLGGCIATGLSGPRRMAVGAARDFVLGTRLVDGRGQHLSFGGRVMKNVAGYDVSRALVGSLGTLGIVTEVALKVLPEPAGRVTLTFAMDQATALDRLNAWAGQSIAITASAWSSGARNVGESGAGSGEPDDASSGERLTVRLEGSEAAVQSAIRRIGGLAMDASAADAFWNDLREQTHPYFGARPPDAPQWRLSLPSVAPPLDAARLGFDDQLIEWGGAQRWIATKVDPQLVRDAAARVGGHAVLWRAADDVKTSCGVFAPLSAPLAAIHRRLKTEFDPERVFNRGRLYPDL